jgi:hypothetical protein
VSRESLQYAWKDVGAWKGGQGRLHERDLRLQGVHSDREESSRGPLGHSALEIGADNAKTGLRKDASELFILSVLGCQPFTSSYGA